MTELDPKGAPPARGGNDPTLPTEPVEPAEPTEPAQPAPTGPAGDLFTYRLVVTFIGFALILVVMFIFLIRIDGGEIPDSLVSLGSGAIGALAGILGPVAAKKSGGGGGSEQDGGGAQGRNGSRRGRGGRK